MKETKAKMIYLEWVDSASHPYWQDENAELELMQCCSVGWRIKETDALVAVAQSISLDDSAKPWSDVIVIPKVSITRIEILGPDNVKKRKPPKQVRK